jgi:hypothetical protein
MPCPYILAQNGKAERAIRFLNNVTRSLLFQASMPLTYKVEALITATSQHIAHQNATILHPQSGALWHPDHLRIFGCKCYPNQSATATHKLTPRSSLCPPWLLRSTQEIPLS